MSATRAGKGINWSDRWKEWKEWRESGNFDFTSLPYSDDDYTPTTQSQALYQNLQFTENGALTNATRRTKPIPNSKKNLNAWMTYVSLNNPIAPPQNTDGERIDESIKLNNMLKAASIIKRNNKMFKKEYPTYTKKYEENPDYVDVTDAANTLRTLQRAIRLLPENSSFSSIKKIINDTRKNNTTANDYSKAFKKLKPLLLKELKKILNMSADSIQTKRKQLFGDEGTEVIQRQETKRAQNKQKVIKLLQQLHELKTKRTQPSQLLSQQENKFIQETFQKIQKLGFMGFMGYSFRNGEINDGVIIDISASESPFKKTIYKSRIIREIQDGIASE